MAVIIVEVATVGAGTGSSASVPPSSSPESAVYPLTGLPVVYRNGTRIDGTWTRARRTAPFLLADSSGAPIALAPGRTWVEFVDETTYSLTDDHR